MQYLCSYDLLISLSVMFSKFIHIISYSRISFFLRLKSIPLYVYTTLYLFIHPSMDIFRLLPLTTVNNAEMIMGVQVSHWDPDFKPIGYIPRSRNARSMAIIFNFLRNLHSIFHSDSTILHSYQWYTFLPILDIFFVLWFWGGWVCVGGVIMAILTDMR